MTVLQQSSIVSRTYHAEYLGLMPYDIALERQQLLAHSRAQCDIPDTILLLQHPHIYTVGRFRGQQDLISPPENVPVFNVSRGGSITYHGPGQLVGYPILNIKELKLGVRDYIWKLEQAIIDLLRDLSIDSERNPGLPGGVWAAGRKICSIGIHVSRYVTTHGFALNVDPDLRYFDGINPCGIPGAVMTSLSRVLGYPLDVVTVAEMWLEKFSDVFGLRRN
jgi:lipoate-protein ligase B